ncbi:uncharacterized protein LOC123561510 [Mercenaria mercenaria]|uniref:uncharacterized protein LOC123561510 n=1 Tax=Mercenaria mercenaria TaxID=6596 RepID=UPI001E1DFE2D|nr:uncharacterized protein LOC123561510 [Mercenaria mercenaria]
MAFSIGYVGVCEKNIQHLYTTRTLKKPATRKSPQYKPGFLNDLDAERKQRLRNRPFMEYDSKNDIELPKAAAFRNIPKPEVDEIVKRLTMPPKERFHFQYTDHLGYNDWRTAREEKIHHLRETISMFGGSRDHLIRRESHKKSKKEKRHKKNVKQKDGETLPVL